MLRPFVRTGFSILLAFCLIVGAIRLIGAFLPPPALATLQQFDCTPKPCWHGIQLGVTTVPEAARLLSADQTISLVDYHPTDNFVCWTWQNQWHRDFLWDGCYNDLPNPDYMLILTYVNNPLRLGDVLYLLGRPIISRLCTGVVPESYGSLYSPNMRVDVGVPDQVTWIDPDLIVEQIVYFYPQTNVVDAPIRSAWKGFSDWGFTSAYCNG